jgi:hypothetical protein
MKYQRGIALTSLIAWGIIIFFITVLAAKVVPEVLDFYKIKKVVASTANNAEGKTVPEIKQVFDRYADVDSINTITSSDLEIYKEANAVVIAFSYETRIPLFLNVSLLFDFHGESRSR